MKNIRKSSFAIIAAFVLVGSFGVYKIALALGGQGTATIDGGATVSVVQATSHKFTIVLTIGTDGITADAQNPTFTIPAGFTAPLGTRVANAGLVNGDGKWSVSAAGGGCTINNPDASLTVASGQVITVDVTTVCTVAVPDTITLTYQGQSATTMSAAPLVIKTAVDNGAGAPTAIAAPPTITVTAASATLNVINHVIIDNGGTATAGDFTMNVTGTNVSDSSFAGAENPGTTVTLNAGAYSVDENAFSGYTKSLGTNCSGTIAAGETKTCTITNDDIAPSLTLDNVVVNDIKVTKEASKKNLTSGPAKVTFTYRVTNEGDAALSDISVKDDKCDSVKYVSGDDNNNDLLDTDEDWKYTCKKTVKKTETNTVTAKGTANGEEVKDTDTAKVTVSTPGLPKAGVGPADEENNFWSNIVRQLSSLFASRE